MLQLLRKKQKEILFYTFVLFFFIGYKFFEKNVKINTPEIYNSFELKMDANSALASLKREEGRKLQAELIRPSVPKSLSNCTTRTPRLKIGTRGKFTIVTNFVVAKRQVNCRHFVTYTTHGDFRYLDNLVPLVERWVAPVSVALYTPSSELQPTLNRIAYLRECTTPLIREWVTFHMYSETDDFTDPTPFLTHLEKSSKDLGICEDALKFTGSLKLSGRKGDRVYPINVARNVARLAATTHFVFASDIELFPSIDFNRQFIELLIRDELMFKSRAVPYVFVLPVFEINNVTKLPDTKRELVRLIQKRLATPFHLKKCGRCHIIPKYKNWIKKSSLNMSGSLHVFHVAKRQTPHSQWEPIYIGTNQDPLYEERLSWEGLVDKMSQMYALCLLDYDFMILDNAFLVHRNGIQQSNLSKSTFNPHPRQFTRINNQMSRHVRNELKSLYGQKPSCDPRYSQRNRKGTTTQLPGRMEDSTVKLFETTPGGQNISNITFVNAT